MNFEIFDKRMAPLAKAPSITIQKRGIFSINKAAHKLIGEPETVELLFDKEAQVIAMRQSSESHAYTIRPQSKKDTSVSRRYKPFAQDTPMGKMLCIDLKGESVEVHGNRGKSKVSDESEEDPDGE